MSKQTEILLGFEIGTGEAVSVPLGHCVICGVTQQSGKTTTLEALVQRSHRQAIAFVTKEAESSFVQARRIPPYFVERADWQFVEAILEATMRQKMKFERAWIIRVTRGASTLKEVQQNVRNQMSKARGLSADIYLQLNEYFKLILPEIGQVNMRAGPLRLQHGINVMDLSLYSMQMQSLIISSTLSAVYKMRDTTVIIPEAWEFLPQQRNSPVKLAAEALIRKGAAAQNFVWLDSQDMSGIDKTILKQVSVWILGVQREINEVEHTLNQIPMSRKSKPKPEDVMRLKLGEFFVCYRDVVKKVYVCPAWLAPEIATRYAHYASGLAEIQSAARVVMKRAQRLVDVNSELRDLDKRARNGELGRLAAVIVDEEVNVSSFVPKQVEEDAVWKEKYDEAQRTILALQKQIDELQHRLGVSPPKVLFDAVVPVTKVTDVVPQSSELPGDEEALYQRFKARLFSDNGVTIQLAKILPSIEYSEERSIIRVTHADLRGRVAELILDGFFGTRRSSSQVYGELSNRGVEIGFKGNVSTEMDALTTMGFFRREVQANRAVFYVLQPGIEERVKRSHAAA